MKKIDGVPIQLNSEKLRTYHACLSLPPPPIPFNFTKIQAEVATAAEKEAKARMERVTIYLEFKMGIDPTTNCVHFSAILDGAYRSLFASLYYIH